MKPTFNKLTTVRNFIGENNATRSGSWSISFIVVSTLLISGFVALVALELWSSYQKAVERARTEAQNLAKTLEHDIATTIHRTDLTLLDVTDVLKARAGDKALTSLPTKSVNEMLKQRSSRIPDIAGLWISDSTGDLRYSAIGTTEKANNADREYFIAQRDNPQAGLYISKPIMGRVSKTRVVIISRRLNNLDGSFAGIIFASIKLDYFTNLFSSLNIGKDGNISIRNNKYELLTVHPTNEIEIGKALEITPALTLLFNQGHGTYVTRSKFDNVERTVSFRCLGTYPLIIFVGLSAKDFLSDWFHNAITLSLVTLLLSIFAILLLYKLNRTLKLASDTSVELRNHLATLKN